MKIIRFRSLKYIPASHEDAKRPFALKKVLFSRDDLEKGRVQMINWVKLLPGTSFRAHYHPDMNELYLILNGQVLIRIADEQAKLGKGDAVIIPQGKIHTMKNLGASNAYYLALGIATADKGRTVLV